MSMEWWRSWHGAPTDNKWLLIGRRAGVAPGIVSAIAWALLDCASQANNRGSVAGFDIETYAAFSGFTEADIEAVLTALREKNIIDQGERLTAWDKRQPKREDDSRERVRAHRERQREQVTTVTPPDETDVTQCNAVKQEVTLDTDTDKKRGDKRREERGSKPRSPSDPNLHHPAVVVYRNICHRTPNHEQRQAIADTITDTAHFEDILRRWMREGWNPGSVEKQLNVYRNGWQERSNGREPKPDPKLEALRMLEEEDPSG